MLGSIKNRIAEVNVLDTTVVSREKKVILVPNRDNTGLGKTFRNTKYCFCVESLLKWLEMGGQAKEIIVLYEGRKYSIKDAGWRRRKVALIDLC